MVNSDNFLNRRYQLSIMIFFTYSNKFKKKLHENNLIHMNDVVINVLDFHVD